MENVTHSQEKRHPTKTKLEMTQILKLAENYFKAAILTMLDNIKENMLIMISI